MGILPVVAVDAVSHLGCLNGTLDETGILEFLEMLADGGLGDGQLVMDVTEVAFLSAGKELQYLYPGGMSQGLGKACYLLGFKAIVSFRIHEILEYIDDKIR